MRRILLGMALAVLASGAWAKTVTADDVAQFKVGTATVQDVEGRLGKPQGTATNSDGTATITYVSAKSHVKGASFIPLVGLFAGGATASTSATVFTFGPDGLLKATSTNTSNVDCGVGSCK